MYLLSVYIKIKVALANIDHDSISRISLINDLWSKYTMSRSINSRGILTDYFFFVIK